MLFCPSESEIYPDNETLQIEFIKLDKILEGEFRPGHFNGVSVVLAKLFNIVSPDKAYFGLKDLQQCMIVKKLVRDLSFNIEIVCIPTIRESDGLAMSSRNLRLNPLKREKAAAINRALEKAKKSLLRGIKFETVKLVLTNYLCVENGLKLDYFELVELPGFNIAKKIIEPQSYALCIAIYVDEIRLIDNILL